MRSDFIIFLLFFFGFFHSNKAHSHLLCEVSLSSPESDFSGDASLASTERLIVYFNHLLGEGVMTDEQLLDFISGLEEGKIINPFQREKGSAAEIQWGGVQEYIDQDVLDQEKLLSWALLKLDERNRVRVKRDETSDKTQKIYKKIEFHPVHMGRFRVGQGLDRVEVHLTYPIEVMSTPVTQAHWVELMGENPSAFSEGEHSFTIIHNGRRVWLQPDHPVERVSWWSALVFANRLSEKHGLKPAYVFSEVQWDRWDRDTRAENGNLRAESGGVKIRQANGRVRDPYGKDNRVYYRAEGYRLPTEAEQQYLFRQGRNVGFYFGDHTNVADYAWYFDNSHRKTHPVGELKPMILGGNPFYDLHGNVAEWAWNKSSQGFRGGDNPVGSKHGQHRIISGGCRLTSLSELSSMECRRPADSSSNEVGFRLVRTIGRSKK